MLIPQADLMDLLLLEAKAALFQELRLHFLEQQEVADRYFSFW